MEIAIFTEGSSTTADESDVKYIEDFFRGGFLSIKSLSKELVPYGNVSIHIHSDRYGYVHGSDSPTELSDTNDTEPTCEFFKAISEASRTSDVVIILLTRSLFNEMVTEQWEALVTNAKSNSIWCIGASSSAISTVDIDKLQSEVEAVLTYKRVGVARISSECKEELIETINTATE
jgi:hypothetical protein